MSPIEKNVWEDIRYYGLPFYPQIPCGRYFIDFADPYRQIAIEVDSKEYHQDKQKDLERENYLRKNGFITILRFRGKDTFANLEDYSGNKKEIAEYTIAMLWADHYKQSR
jgi:very-short-patch-repair endonuclease